MKQITDTQTVILARNLVDGYLFKFDDVFFPICISIAAMRHSL